MYLIIELLKQEDTNHGDKGTHKGRGPKIKAENSHSFTPFLIKPRLKSHRTRQIWGILWRLPWQSPKKSGTGTTGQTH